MREILQKSAYESNSFIFQVSSQELSVCWEGSSVLLPRMEDLEERQNSASKKSGDIGHIAYILGYQFPHI